MDRGGAVFGAEKIDFGFQEADDGRVFEEPFFVSVAARAIAFFVQRIPGGEVVFSCLGGGVAGHYAEEGGPGVDGGSLGVFHVWKKLLAGIKVCSSSSSMRDSDVLWRTKWFGFVKHFFLSITSCQDVKLSGIEAFGCSGREQGYLASPFRLTLMTVMEVDCEV